MLNCYQSLDLQDLNPNSEWQAMMIISPNGHDYPISSDKTNNNYYAVPIDDLDINAIFHSRIGNPVSLSKDNAFGAYVRECWDIAGDDQLLFIDWNKLSEKKY